MKINKCCLCGGVIKDKFGGHNAQPLKDGFCCDNCNLKVVEARLKGTAIKDGENNYREITIDNTKSVKQIFDELMNKSMREKIKFERKK